VKVLEDVKNDIIDACENLYGPFDHNDCIMVKDKTEDDVRNEIANAINFVSTKTTMKYIDMCIYITQFKDTITIRK